jgi:hypothetical protein
MVTDKRTHATPSLFSASTVTFLFHVTFLYVHRHFSLRPVITDAWTHAQTSDFIYKIGSWYIRVILKVTLCFTPYLLCFWPLSPLSFQ